MNAILILTAIELEASILARRLELPPLPGLPFRAFGRGAVRLAPVGLRASLLTRRWSALREGLSRPLVVSAGVCGGLDPGLAAGDLVVPDSVLAPDGRLLPVTASSQRAAVLRAVGDCRGGCLATTREVVATAEGKAALRGRSGADAVDTESADIVDAAAAAGYPCLVVRGVSDSAGQPLPDELLRLVTPEGRLRLGGALALALGRPRVIPRALELRRATGRALAAVARALAALAA